MSHKAIDVSAVLDTLREDKEAKRLLEGALTVQRRCGHFALDDIHFLAAAVADDYAPARVRDLFVRFGVHHDAVNRSLDALQVGAIITCRQKDGVDDVLMRGHTRDMLVKLAGRHALHLETLRRSSGPMDCRDSWSWYATLVLLALSESESYGVRKLTMLATPAPTH